MAKAKSSKVSETSETSQQPSQERTDGTYPDHEESSQEQSQTSSSSDEQQPPDTMDLIKQEETKQQSPSPEVTKLAAGAVAEQKQRLASNEPWRRVVVYEKSTAQWMNEIRQDDEVTFRAGNPGMTQRGIVTSKQQGIVGVRVGNETPIAVSVNDVLMIHR